MFPLSLNPSPLSFGVVSDPVQQRVDGRVPDAVVVRAKACARRTGPRWTFPGASSSGSKGP